MFLSCCCGFCGCWFGRWLGMYFEYKQWKREDSTYGGVRKFSVTGFKSKENEIEF